MFGACAVGGSGPALAQRWIFEPSIGAEATLTNNANYDTSTQREGDLIISVVPGISFSREGPRLRVNGQASLNAIGYVEGTQTNRILPQANILANLEAIDRFFFIDATLVANQETLNPFLPQSDADSTFNKYTYALASISPYLQGTFSNNWRYLVRSDNSYTYTSQATQQLSNAYYGHHVAEVARTPSPLGTTLRVQNEVTRFDETPEQDQYLSSARASVNYAFTPRFVFGLRGGYEHTNYTADEESGAIYGAELSWSPNPRTRLEGFWEERFFGPNYVVDFSNRQRRFASNLAFSRTISTYAQQIFQLPATGNVSGLLDAILVARFPDPIDRAAQVQDLITRQGLPSSLPDPVNVFSQSVNILTSASGTFALIGARNTLALNAFYLKTALLPDARIPPTFVVFNNNIQKGASLSLSHSLSPVMTLNASAAWSDTRGFDQTAGQQSEQSTFILQATRQLTPRSQVFIGARYQQQDSNTDGIGDSSEAAIFVGLFHRL